MKKTALIATLFTFAGLLCACNTVSGFGQDVEKAGQSVSHAAERAKH
ncbi:MAG: entericidin A/B family lipoprotein [Cardiobacteriaceae bacterium]|nr:entericidin A/B family lipoprotein [Cardiobacteriaceae bacterium]